MLRRLAAFAAVVAVLIGIAVFGAPAASAVPSYCVHTASMWNGLRVVHPGDHWCIFNGYDHWFTQLQTDSNVAEYDAASHARWSSRTTYYAPLVMVLQADGNVVLYHDYGTWWGGPAVWQAQSGGHSLPNPSTWHYEITQTFVVSNGITTHFVGIYLTSNDGRSVTKIGIVGPVTA